MISTQYNIDKLFEVDNARFERRIGNEFTSEFEIDDKSIQTQILIDKDNKYKMSGKLEITSAKTDLKPTAKYEYQALFSKKNLGDFKLILKSEEGKVDTLLLKRETDGSLCLIKNGTKTKLNEENVKSNNMFKEISENLDESEEDYRLKMTLMLLVLAYCTSVAKKINKTPRDID